MFHPLDDFPIELLLNGDMGHARRWPCAVPVPLARGKPDHITCPNLLNRSSFALTPAAAGRNDQSLSVRMGMPCCASAGFKCDACALNTRRLGSLEERIDSDSG